MSGIVYHHDDTINNEFVMTNSMLIFSAYEFSVMAFENIQQGWQFFTSSAMGSAQLSL